jgi:alpha-glucosidase
MGWPSWAFSNHDAPRAVSRWFAPAHRAAGARLTMLLLICLRGNIFLYQGDELGLPQALIGFSDLKDPEAIANWPRTLGRDGARTPMPWRGALEHAGFTSGEPWLVIGNGHAALAVDRQQDDPLSQLNLTRRLIALRQRRAALRTGSLRFIEVSARLLAFERTAPGQQLLCVFNLGPYECRWQPEAADSWRIIEQVGAAQAWVLPAYSGLIAERT